jgi:predicted nuclease of predicted toxin-antitoxin system
MKLLVDMNLPPKLSDLLVIKGIKSEHWINLGSPIARDSDIMQYAKQHDYIVLTCDLDFSAILAVTHGEKPSIIQVRAQSMQWSDMADMIIKAIKQSIKELESGAILTIDAKKSRIRLLPL